MRKIIVFSCFIAFLLVVALSESNLDVEQTTQLAGDNRNVAASYTEHEPISISSNADFASQGWPGNGTVENPYVIEGLNITDKSTCIKIMDTTAYFEIKNCFISAANLSGHIGIRLFNANHGTVENCTFNSHHIGLYWSDSPNCTIANNTAADNHNGIVISKCANCSMTGNTISNNSYGLMVKSSDNCLLANNSAIENPSGGLVLQFSENCVVADNTLIDNGLRITGVATAEWLHDISDNTVNGQPLGYFSSTTDAVIEGNNYGQVILANCTNVTIEDGVFIDASTAISLGHSSNCSVVNNTASGNTGFSLNHSDNCTVEDNEAFDNVHAGFDISESKNCILSNNMALNNSLAAFLLRESPNSIATLNTANNSMHAGFMVDRSDGCSLIGNVVSNSSFHGIYLRDSGGCVVKDNTLAGNGLSISGSEAHWLHDISGNIVNGKPLGYFKSLDDEIIDGSQYGQVILADCSGFTVIDGVFFNASAGIQIGYSTQCTLQNNTSSNNRHIGIYLESCEGCQLTDNTATGSMDGFYVVESQGCTWTNNTAIWNFAGFYFCGSAACQIGRNTAINNSQYGFYLETRSCTLVNNVIAYNLAFGAYLTSFSEDNMLYLNRFLNNSVNAYDQGISNAWDNGTIGNYWSNYDGVGSYAIPGQSNSTDNHPLDMDGITTGTTTPGGPYPLVPIIGIVALVGVVVVILAREARDYVQNR